MSVDRHTGGQVVKRIGGQHTMMYSEFIEHSNFSEQYISFTEYTTYIEPIYMAADQIPTKQEFITLLEDTFKSLVNPVIEKAMHSLSLEDKLMYLECGSQQIQEHLERIDFEARKLAYQYLKLMLTL